MVADDPVTYLGAPRPLFLLMGWVLAASIAFGVGGVFMQSADGFSRPVPSGLVALAFLTGAVLLTLAVRAEGLTTAYTIGLGIEAVISVVLGRWVFGEHLTGSQLLGVVLILGGVASVRLG